MHRVQIAYLQETRWKGNRWGEYNGYKLLYSESEGAKNGVGFLVSLKYHRNVIEVTRYNDRIMALILVLGEEVVMMVCTYAPNVRLGDLEKREFQDCLDLVVRAIRREERIFIGGDLNGHIGKDNDGYQSIHWGSGFGERNESGRNLLEFAVAHDLGILNSFFRKRDMHLITFSSGVQNTQMDYLLTRQVNGRWWKDCKVITGETTVIQHHLLVGDILLREKLVKGDRSIRPRIRWGNLKGDKVIEFKDKVIAKTVAQLSRDANRISEDMVTTIIHVANGTLGVATGKSSGPKDTWWWSEEVQNKIRGKHQSFRDLLRCANDEEQVRPKDKYKKAKREAKRAMTEAKNTADKLMNAWKQRRRTCYVQDYQSYRE
ncbi:uncharacterized protein LOC110907294 [Helianthus annuus]|uniref:uncharacterized protein LOC110907294 n=1 Tax=Helianthus annuus TaxID=4232 RepID=UPI000B8FDD9D|nr:uncharacterized protein LOC110907294 [Helianthus annuus]